MNNTPSSGYDNYQILLKDIGHRFLESQKNTIQAINSGIIEAYWNIGKYIVEFEQQGNTKAQYGKSLLLKLSKDLKLQHGKGFSVSNLQRFRQIYIAEPIYATLSHKLSWSHWVELLKVSNNTEREFYKKQSITANWSIRELRRQKTSGLFLRLAASKDKAGILAIAEKDRLIESATDIQRDSYIFEFLKIPEPYHLSETALEQSLCDHLQQFLLELGKGFTFVGRQYRITLNNTHYKVDLVFYHRILRCFVLIDLKINDVKHQDIGQMNMYMGYFAKEENINTDNPPIGIILSKDKDDLLVEYATYGMDSQLFVQKYQLYLPNEAELRAEIERTLEEQNNDE